MGKLWRDLGSAGSAAWTKAKRVMAARSQHQHRHAATLARRAARLYLRVTVSAAAQAAWRG